MLNFLGSHHNISIMLNVWQLPKTYLIRVKKNISKNSLVLMGAYSKKKCKIPQVNSFPYRKVFWIVLLCGSQRDKLDIHYSGRYNCYRWWLLVQQRKTKPLKFSLYLCYMYRTEFEMRKTITNSYLYMYMMSLVQKQLRLSEDFSLVLYSLSRTVS